MSKNRRDPKRFILTATDGSEEKPLGYFQYYFASDGSVGIDRFIGEADYIDKGVGEKSIKMFTEMIALPYPASDIILDLSPLNKRAIRCYEKIGFRHYETPTTKTGQSAYMMKLTGGNRKS